MSTWDEVVSAALVGVRSRPVTAAGADPVIAVHLPDSDAAQGDPADLALQMASLTAAARAACGPESVSAEPIPVAPDDPRGAMPQLVSTYAVRAMEMTPRMAEWCLTLLADSGLRPPATLLPYLLSRTARQATLRPAISTIVGPRGRWLAYQAPELKAVLDDSSLVSAPPDPSAWTHGEPAERVAYLTALRERDPGAARELLAAGWSGESGTDRELLLPIMFRRASLDDETFLEAALDDRRGKVRAVAADVLDRVDGSAHRGRLVQAAVGAMEWVGGESGLVLRSSGLDLDKLGPADSPLARDGINLTTPKGVALQDHVLAQLLSRIPPLHWEQQFGRAPETIVAAIDSDEAAIAQGLCSAAVTFEDRRWATALMTHPGASARVIALADPEAVVRAFPTLAAERQLVGLHALPAPWSDQMARHALRLLDSMLANARVVRGNVLNLFDLMSTGLPATDDFQSMITVVRERHPHATIPCATLSEALRIRSVLIRELP
ncbi:DUF5691 domain-containing protein [Gordonia sp. VNK1]|uniref:DUF5691 domain-containing protein n=1 Tax=Gordonia oleivorans TaxID=3156618 RepID=UPI0032B445FA